MLIEYIDKIVDLRRGMIDDGKVPQSLQKPLKALESRGNPYGKLEKKRAEWTKVPGFQESCKVEIADGKKNQANTLFFVDSVTSYDDRIQAIGRATARILSALGDDFGILGPAEKDSGHEARRFGQELLFRSLRDQNTAAITRSGAKRIVTADPHALNALKHDYAGIPPRTHQSVACTRSEGQEAATHAVEVYVACLRLQRSLLPGPTQSGVRRPASGARCDPGAQASRDGALSRSFFLLRWRWTDAVL